MRRTHPVSLASVLDNIVDSRQLRLRLDERRAVSLWAEVVGSNVAALAIAIDAHAGLLRVRCHNSVLRQELSLEREALVRNLNSLARTAVIKDITFV